MEVNIFEGVEITKFCDTCPIKTCAERIQEDIGRGYVLDDVPTQTAEINTTLKAAALVISILDNDQNHVRGFGASGSYDEEIGKKPYSAKDARVNLIEIAEGRAYRYGSLSSAIKKCSQHLVAETCK